MANSASMRVVPFVYVARILAVVVTALALSACTVRFAPEYDPALEKGLVDVYEDFQNYYGRLESGKKSYADNEAFYRATESKLNVLKLRADSRPSPPGITGIFSFFNKKDAEEGAREAVGSAPDLTGENIADILEILESFRGLHESQDTLSPSFVANSRDIIESSFKSSLAYEKILNR